MAGFPAKAGGSWQRVADSWPWGYSPDGDSWSKGILTHMLGLVLRSTTSLKNRFWADLWSTANEPPELSGFKEEGNRVHLFCQAIIPVIS